MRGKIPLLCILYLCDWVAITYFKNVLENYCENVIQQHNAERNM